MNNLKKIAVLSTTLLAANTMAADDSKLLQLYGKVNVAAVAVDDGDDISTDVVSNASRFGAKGEYKLDNGLTAVYKYEWQVNIDDKEDNLTARDQYLGLKGKFGTVLLGQMDTALKLSQGKIDLFSDYQGDIKRVWKGENRMKDTVAYRSPSFNNIRVNISYIAQGGDADADHGVSASATYGDAKLKKSKFYGAVAIDSKVKGYDTVRLVGSAKLGSFKVGVAVQQQENIESGAETDGFFTSLAYRFEDYTFKGQYQMADTDGGDDKSVVSLGLDYKLASKTKAYTWYSIFDNDSAQDKSYFAVGLEHKF
jgi:predicted porin